MDPCCREAGYYTCIAMRVTRLAYFLPALLLLSNAWGKPNIIMIMADDMGYETVGANGCDDYKTPNIDAMAKKGKRPLLI